ncbi:hypothetical protein BC937DRAFT_93097 [Endogone sp. FLAS-F59071]|nr:hypothetical protein BC937DRAFT_93097 [Endogone sp. FLAS-F59071]|eukprot:RUS21295.1 hypothetical protein BC937DRAFT_93097 [Endogone sp. FLAS-F59071]
MKKMCSLPVVKLEVFEISFFFSFYGVLYLHKVIKSVFDALPHFLPSFGTCDARDFGIEQQKSVALMWFSSNNLPTWQMSSSERASLLRPQGLEDLRKTSPAPRSMKQRLSDPAWAWPLATLGFVAVFVPIVLLILAVEDPDVGRSLSHDSLLRSLYPRNILTHLSALDEIAKEHNGTRSIGEGYNASAKYVADLLYTKLARWCDVQLQPFVAPVWERTGPANLTVDYAEGKWRVEYQEGVDFAPMRYGGQSAVLADQQVLEIPDHGCNVSDFADVVGKIALIREGLGAGACELWEAAWTAEQHNATAVIFYNSPKRRSLLFNRIRIVAWKEGDPLMTIPVIAVTASLGQTLALASAAGIGRVDLSTNTAITLHTTHNVLCVGKHGDDDNRILVGAHLDSVPAGPGLVDNASGSATLLEILLLLERHHPRFYTHNKLVFAWWGAEEVGLLGSRHYVRTLPKKEKRKIVASLNFDMLASPNGIPFIHNGTDAPSVVRQASVQLQHAFEQYYNRKKRDYEITDMTAGSDFLPFLEGGIPSGGILTGAGEFKTEEQRHIFGGFANTPMDPCYHRSRSFVLTFVCLIITRSIALPAR